MSWQIQGSLSTSVSTFNKVKNRAMDVSSIQSKRSDLPDGITVEPDMSIQEQLTERSLMKERWTLIQAGVNKKDIKIKSSFLCLRGKKHAEVSS